MPRLLSAGSRFLGVALQVDSEPAQFDDCGPAPAGRVRGERQHAATRENTLAPREAFWRNELK
jgi:hypothetical protein